MTDRGKSYDRVAKLYDTAAHLYSGGQIRALKAAQIGELQPGQRILYAGVGDGEDAVLAANRQVTLTLLDLSQGMLDRAAAKFQAVDAEGCIEVVCSDVLRHERPGHYDIVVANFFLNVVYRAHDEEAVLARLATMLKPGGKLLIGDFSYPRGWITTRRCSAPTTTSRCSASGCWAARRCIRSTTTRSILTPPICAQRGASASR